VGVDLRKVAARAGVATSTASRALSGSTRVHPETRARVVAAAQALGYRPNANARALRTARSQFAGLVVTNLLNASFHVIAEVVQRQLASEGFQMLLSVTGGDPEQERLAVRVLSEHSAAGVIFVGSDAKASEAAHRDGLPVVHLARRPEGQNTGDCVLGDELVGARTATEHLISLGHKRIAIIAGPSDVLSGRERMQGFRLAMAEAGLPVADDLVISGPLLPETGADAVTSLLALPARRRATALVVANHEASFGVLPRLQESGVRVPDELSVVAVEDSQLLRWWHPPITVIDNNAAQMGELATRLLLTRINGSGATSSGHDYRVGTRLLERASCAAPARQRSRRP